jgi:hypothetical protein
MQSSLPVEPTDRNIKAVDIADSAEIAKIVAIRVGGPISGACAGRSRVASARLAGIGGGMFSMMALSAPVTQPQRTKRHVLRLAGIAPADSRKPPLGQDPFIRDKFAQGRTAKRFINYLLGIVGP